MTEPSEAALRRACEILGRDIKYALGFETGYGHGIWECIRTLARHLDAEDKAAREAVFGHLPDLSCMAHDFAKRHILPPERMTVRDVLLKQLPGFDEACALIENALRDAGLLKETDCGI